MNEAAGNFDLLVVLGSDDTVNPSSVFPAFIFVPGKITDAQIQMNDHFVYASISGKKLSMSRGYPKHAVGLRWG